MSAADRIEERAALWLVQRDEPEWDASDDAALAAWLDESFAHQAAFWRLEHGWRAADRIVATGAAVAEPTPEERPARWWRSTALMALAAVLVLACCIGLMVARGKPEDAPQQVRFATAVGERRSVELADGSRVMLNTDSVMRAAIVDGRRRVWLDKGEAFFDVVHQADHPFVIATGGHRVTVLGTRFSVRRDGSATKVAVERGAVRIDDGHPTTEERGTIVAAGDVAIARGHSVLLAARSSDGIEDLLSWRTGVLTFDQTTLAEAAEEFNRYNRRQIRFTDQKAAQIRIGGSVEAGNIDAFARLLHEAFGLEVEHDTAGVTISS
jgi:transmembrane sensor